MAVEPRTPHPDDALRALAWPRRLTLAGLWAERLTRAFWPLWTILLLAFAAAAFELHQIGPLTWVRIGAGVFALATLLALGWGLWRFRRPTGAEALARLDATLPGRPIAALHDTQAIGAGDAASAAVWRVHLARMADRLAHAKPVSPDLQLSSRDPYSLRYVALTAAVMAALFGSLWRVTEVAGIAPGPAQAIPGGPVWEAWAKPPAYTGKPTIYLNDIPEGELALPAGTRIQIRVYGAETGLSIDQTIAQVAPPAAENAAAAAPAGLAGMTDLTLSQSGRLAIEGNGGRAWQVVMTPDAPPVVEVSGAMGREADGRFKQGFTARDDYGVTGGTVTISLDLAAVDRRHGLTIAPETIAPVTLDLPMPVKGKRDQIVETLIDDLSKSVLSNMPVSMVFSVTDAAGGTGSAQPHAVILPGKRFFDPMAAAVIEMRRDLLWNRENLTRSTQIIKALLYRPEDMTRSQNAAKRLRVLMREMDQLTPAAFGSEKRDAVAEELWQIAGMFEEGDLASAAERLQRAQDRLEEAIRNGASPEEIDQLMKEMQQAMKDYTRELGRQAQNGPPQPSEGGQTITGDQLQEMLDEIERLMKEGRTAEAMQKMEELRQLMENLQVQQGQGGEGQDGQGNPSMKELGETLKDQQGLSDDAYRDMQRGRSGQDGQQDPGDLADRQRDLRQRLDEMQNGQLPGDGSEKGEAGRDALDRAEEAMREAERALEEGDLSGALDRQAEAMQAMRDGMKDFGDALAEENRDQAQEGGGNQEEGRADPNGRDPLGREDGDAARIGSDNNMVQNDPDTRAQDLLDEIRRRSGQAERPDAELDYLKRLLDLF